MSYSSYDIFSTAVIEDELLQSVPTDYQLCQYVLDMVAPDWCGIAAELGVSVECTNKPLIDCCMTVFCEYMKHSRPNWRQLLVAITGNGREPCAKLIGRLLPG